MLKAIKYESKYKEQWDSFVDESWNGTIFHKQGFLEYHEDKFEDLSFLLLNKKDKIVSVIPAAKRGDCLWSHPGASFGGPVVKNSHIEEILEIVDGVETFALESGLSTIEITLTPNLLHTQPTDGIEFGLSYKGFKQSASELSICVPLGDIELAKRRLRGIKCARCNGVTIYKNYDFEGFWKILSNNLRIRHSTTPTHSLDEILELNSRFPEHIQLWSAFLNSEMVAGIVVFINNDTSFETFYIAQDYTHKKARALDLLIYTLSTCLEGEGFKYMNFGITSEQRGLKINFGLAKFKEEFGGCDIVRRSYSKRIA